MLPKQGRHLIIGGPGTGKSVLALLRANRHHDAEESYVFLVYNHLLRRASMQLFRDREEVHYLRNQQWESWFGGQIYELSGENLPRLPSEPNTNYTDIDWDGVQRIVGEINVERLSEQRSIYLIIDEGQDMPPQFYRALLNMGYENVYVVADQSQQIKKQNSTRQQIQDSLAIQPSDVIELKKNHRNTHWIAKLARHFYTGDPASPPPELPAPPPEQLVEEGSVEMPVLYEYAPGDFEKVINQILIRAHLNSERLIGVIVANDKVRTRYIDAFRTIGIWSVGERPRVTTYHMNMNRQEVESISFDEGGIMVINAMSCKGLEFDTVFLADINEHPYWDDIADQKKRLFYVMVARAMKRIVLLKG